MGLADKFVTACVIAKDVAAAKAFYTEKLGLKEVPGPDDGGVLLEAGMGSKIFIYKSDASKPQNTVASFSVDDVLATVKELKANGVEFETYDMDPIKTDEDNIAHLGDLQAAWFKDPEGNILGINNQGQVIWGSFSGRIDCYDFQIPQQSSTGGLFYAVC